MFEVLEGSFFQVTLFVPVARFGLQSVSRPPFTHTYSSGQDMKTVTTVLETKKVSLNKT